ncbi:TerC family protein [Lapillicoccus sp.]|uniref:TerC family protein n=1 Tax=Lapillicoccus sp. TaxID=1909287 RepID=UPI0025F8DC50|nr:TerC family protein [Lapillicoccus sp.]
MYDVPLWLWIGFAVTVVVALTIDLLAHRDDHVIGFKEAARWSIGWVGLAVVFGVVVWTFVEPAMITDAAGALVPATTESAGVQYFTAWLLEKSLSVDNLFVFALIFAYFKVPAKYQHRVLFFGVIGALVFRGIFLALGVQIVERFSPVLFLFAAVLLYSAWKLIKGDDDDYDPSTSFALKAMRKVIPMKDEYHGTKFFIKEAGKRYGTPLLAVVVAIEAADLIFAVDSVPAVLAVSSDAFIVYTSNAFAILGLRALYFLLSGLLEKFHYLGKGLAVILAFIGLKLILQASHENISTSVPEIPSLASLAVIVVLLAGSIILSLARPLPVEEQTTPDPTVEAADIPAATATGDTVADDPEGGSVAYGSDGRNDSSLEKDLR